MELFPDGTLPCVVVQGHPLEWPVPVGFFAAALGDGVQVGPLDALVRKRLPPTLPGSRDEVTSPNRSKGIENHPQIPRLSRRPKYGLHLNRHPKRATQDHP